MLTVGVQCQYVRETKLRRLFQAEKDGRAFTSIRWHHQHSQPAIYRRDSRKALVGSVGAPIDDDPDGIPLCASSTYRLEYFFTWVIARDEHQVRGGDQSSLSTKWEDLLIIHAIAMPADQ